MIGFIITCIVLAYTYLFFSKRIHYLFESEKIVTDNPPSLHEINNRNSNGPTWKDLKGGFWDRPHPDWMMKRKKYGPRTY